ncbi:Hypothetical predicted protein, partial [Paramuricea clavata]
MRGILVALLILQLVLLSEGWWRPRRPQRCPRNPKLESWKKAVKQSLATKGVRGKRQLASA